VIPENFDELPKFQKLQYMFAAHVRDPVNQAYDGKVVSLEKPIEQRRLAAYESLFFNNVHGFFSNLFPVLKSIVGDERWEIMVREYMQKHQSRTPLFHELGQEFILFLQNEYDVQESDPECLLELAHYEWVELAVSIDENELTLNPEGLEADLDTVYELSPLAWPLAYEWPVNRISPDNFTEPKPDWVTTLLVYRDTEDNVQFMELSPVLYELLQLMADNEGGETVRTLLSTLASQLEMDESTLAGFALDILQNFIDEHLITPKS